MESNVSEPLSTIHENILIENSPKPYLNPQTTSQTFLKKPEPQPYIISEAFQKKDKLAYSPNSFFKVPSKLAPKPEKSQISSDFPKVTLDFLEPVPKPINKDLEMQKLSQEINYFRERYLFKLAEISELEAKIKELSEVIDDSKKDNLNEKKQYLQVNKENLGNFMESKQKTDSFKNEFVSQDIGISPIRSLSLTEKTATDRIEALTQELEETKKRLKTFEDTEQILKMKIPEGGVQHLAYYELITGLWRVIDCLKTHYNDIIQESFQKFKAKNEILENRDGLLRKKINRMQEIHNKKLEEFQEKDLEFVKNKNLLETTQEKYKKLKEEHKKLKNEVSVFKAECKEKLKKARADVDMKEQIEECERTIENLKNEKERVKNECEKDKLEFLSIWQEEKNKIIQDHELEKQSLYQEIRILKQLREPIIVQHKL